MRTLSITFLLTFATLASLAQVPFPTDSVVWKDYYVTKNGPDLTRRMEKYEYINDTVFTSGATFIGVKSSNSNNTASFYLSIDDSLGTYVSLLGNPWDTNNVRPLYNFNLEVGDSMRTSEVISSSQSIVWYIESKGDTVLNDGLQRKYFEVANYDYGFRDEDLWISGIGSIHGLLAPVLEPSGLFEFTYHNICFTNLRNGFVFEPMFSDNFYDCSTELSVATQQFDDNSVLIHQDLSNKLIVIQSEIDCSYRVVNSIGQVVDEGNVSSQFSPFTIDPFRWGRGFYLFYFYTETSGAIIGAQSMTIY